MSEEKRRAKELFKKEYLHPAGIVFAELMIFIITFAILMSASASFGLCFAVILLVCGLPLLFLVPYVKKRNQKARENLSRRLAYDDKAPDFDYGSQDSEIVQLREMAMKEYDKKRFTFGKVVLLYMVGWYFAKLPIILIVDIIDYLPIASDFVVTFFHLILPIVGLILILRHNKKLKKQLDEKLDIINKEIKYERKI
ncbi:MAG: hypothetical protein NC177_10435 [Ruminococcus flavefaciens]|nr:hypothetical protein [Ruminococcus flavefaciens]